MKKRGILKSAALIVACILPLTITGCKKDNNVVEQVKTYTINYELNGGTNNESNPVTFKSNTNDITLLEPTKPGYDFLGWYLTDLDGEKITTITKELKENVKLVAKWREHEKLAINQSYEIKNSKILLTVRVKNNGESNFSNVIRFRFNDSTNDDKTLNFKDFKIDGESVISRTIDQEDKFLGYDLNLGVKKGKEVVITATGFATRQGRYMLVSSTDYATSDPLKVQVEEKLTIKPVLPETPIKKDNEFEIKLDIENTGGIEYLGPVFLNFPSSSNSDQSMKFTSINADNQVFDIVERVQNNGENEATNIEFGKFDGSKSTFIGYHLFGIKLAPGKKTTITIKAKATNIKEYKFKVLTSHVSTSTLTINIVE